MNNLFSIHSVFVFALVFAALLGGSIYVEKSGELSERQYMISDADMQQQLYQARKQLLLAKIDQLEQRALVMQWLLDLSNDRKMAQAETIFPEMSDEQVAHELDLMARSLNKLNTAAGDGNEITNLE